MQKESSVKRVNGRESLTIICALQRTSVTIFQHRLPLSAACRILSRSVALPQPL